MYSWPHLQSPLLFKKVVAVDKELNRRFEMTKLRKIDIMGKKNTMD